MSALPRIIQGGMGVAISNWTLANAVASQGQLGVVSGTGIGIVLMHRLMLGDEQGDVRRALSHFPYQQPVERIIRDYFVPGGIPADQPVKRPTMWTLKPSKELVELTVIANFVEVFLAKEGHNGVVGINLLEKVQLPNVASLYGAMLAGVDYVIMGAGVPMQIPAVLDKLAQHQPASYRLDVINADKDDEISIGFDPEAIFPGIGQRVGTLKRPNFLPIISSFVLAQALLKRAGGSIEGFVIETPIAGGHNAPPRGQVAYNELGEPIYTDKDVVDLNKMKTLGLPFWLAGGYASPEKLTEALELGAAGIQVGTAFAYCQESGMDAKWRAKVLQQVKEKDICVRTDPAVSPTGFPFKIVMIEGSLSDKYVYDSRERICDIGFLRHIYKDVESIGFRCPAEPIDQYVRKGGKVEDTENRICLCNNLASTAGLPQRRKNGYIEPPIITSGDDLVNLERYLTHDSLRYSARDVIAYLMSGVRETSL
jgi:NAD(P)H-dependent flavin oxidoreductase YrpB (nitropropane dioxygenase family)